MNDSHEQAQGADDGGFDATSEGEAPREPATSDPRIRRAFELMQAIRQRLGQYIVGQPHVIDQTLMVMLSDGHVLIEGKPGLGKTRLVLELARSFGGTFARIQFTPDLMPSDVTGHTLFDIQSQKFTARRGPVFTNLLLADEINRAPAKTQSALLEVMQELHVTLDTETLPVPRPFMVLATQNPIEQEGTYQLPEAQLDRFHMKILIDYPDTAHESQIVAREAEGRGMDLSASEGAPALCGPEEVLEARRAVGTVKAVDSIVDYTVRLVRATRQSAAISIGAGTRGAISLLKCAKACALLNGRDFVIPADVKQLVAPVLRHRIIVAPELAISGQTADHVLASVIQSIEAPRQ